MKSLLSSHPYWVLIMIGLTPVYSEDELNSSSVPSKKPSPPSFTFSYNDNSFTKRSTTLTTTTTLLTTPDPPDAFPGSTIIIRASSPGVSSETIVTREGRIMVTINKPNRTSDTTDFVRNTVPVKEQTPTEPTIKKTEPPWKHARKPNPDLKNKIRGDSRTRGAGPPGPDASMLAYNAFTPQLAEPTTERHVRKPFTTKSRPPPLSYLTSTADSPLPPTAWALTTLKGSAPSAPIAEHVRNTIPATASEPFKSLRPRTTLSSVKPINSFWSTRLSKNPLATTYAVTESTEPSRIEQMLQETLKTTVTAFEEVSKTDKAEMKTFNKEKHSTIPELISPSDNVNISIIEKMGEESPTIKINETHLKSNEEQTTAQDKKQNQTNSVEPIEMPQVVLKVEDTAIKLEETEENNEALKTEEENQLSKIIENKYGLKPETYETNKFINKAENKLVKIIENNHTTENYGNTLTEKPFIESVDVENKEKLNQSQEVSEKPVILAAVVTEFNKIAENAHYIEQENNFNTAVYPLGNIRNETKLTNRIVDEQLKSMDYSTSVNYSETNLNNETELNTIISLSSIRTTINNETKPVLNETDQSTTSMTRATNATQPPINSTTETNLITVMSVKTKMDSNINETSTVNKVTTTTTPLTTIHEEPIPTVLTTTTQTQTIRNDISDFSSSPLTQNSSTTVKPFTTTEDATTVSQESNSNVLLKILENLNTTHENETLTQINSNETILNLENTFNKIINLNSTSKENDIKSITSLESNNKNNTKLINQEITESNTLAPIIIATTTTKVTPKWNNTLLKIQQNHYELNQTNNDIKLGGDLDLPVPTIISVTSQPSTRSNYLRTTTEKVLTTTKFYIKTELPEISTELPPITITDTNLIKEKEATMTTLLPVIRNLNQTNNNYNNETIETTITPLIFRETDDLNEEDGLIYNTTGNDKKFAIETAINMTDHELDENGDESISGEKEMAELIPNNSTIMPEETTVPDILSEAVTTEVPLTTVITTSTTIRTTMFVTTTPIMEEDGITSVEDDNTGMEIEDYDTGVIMPMKVRLFVHATFKEMCLAKDILIDSIVRFFKTVADRSIERKQIKILNLVRECIPPYQSDKGVVVPVHLLIADPNGLYDRSLTNIFVNLVSQEPLQFKYAITQVDKVIAHERTMDTETQGSGTIIAAIVISSIAALCLLFLTILLVIMRKRQRGFNYGQRCTPVSLDDYSLDNISVYNSVRRKAMRASKRSYGNPAFDDPTALSNSLNFAELASAINDKAKLEEEFSKIPIVTVKSDELPIGAELKNRYANVIPLPETRVTLKTPSNNDVDQFINANFVKGAKGADKFYIACQAPMKDTITDFWQMIWEQQSRIIIMLTDLHENGVEKCADYLPPSEVLDCHRVFGDLQVTLKKREAREKYIISCLQLKNLDSNLWREVTHMWYVGWPGRGVPDDYSSVIAFLIEARSYVKSGPPVVIHCSPGTGRTGTIIAIDIAIRDFETNRIVDIPRTVYNIRRDRAGAVQTNQQYTFIYKVLHLYATKLTGGGLDSI